MALHFGDVSSVVALLCNGLLIFVEGLNTVIGGEANGELEVGGTGDVFGV